jgi:hypothetical protein
MEMGYLMVLHIRLGAKIGDLHARDSTVASETEDQMSETIIKNRNLPNPHLFKPFFCTYIYYHLSPYYYLIFKAMGKPT